MSGMLLSQAVTKQEENYLGKLPESHLSEVHYPGAIFRVTIVRGQLSVLSYFVGQQLAVPSAQCCFVLHVKLFCSLLNIEKQFFPYDFIFVFIPHFIEEIFSKKMLSNVRDSEKNIKMRLAIQTGEGILLSVKRGFKPSANYDLSATLI